jgi:hypothetical protein
MPALTVPSSSSLGSFHSGPNVTELLDKKKNCHGSRNISPNTTINSVELKGPIRSHSPGALRVDTRQAAMIQLQGSRRLIQPIVSAIAPGTTAEQMKYSLMSPIASSDSIENIQLKLKHNLSRHAQNG